MVLRRPLTATAGELDLKEAAEITSTALNAFRRDGMTATQAANQLAGAANASATDVHELKYGLSMVAPVASGLGLSFRDTTNALAVFAQNGLKGIRRRNIIKNYAYESATADQGTNEHDEKNSVSLQPMARTSSSRLKVRSSHSLKFRKF